MLALGDAGRQWNFRIAAAVVDPERRHLVPIRLHVDLDPHAVLSGEPLRELGVARHAAICAAMLLPLAVDQRRCCAMSSLRSVPAAGAAERALEPFEAQVRRDRTGRRQRLCPGAGGDACGRRVARPPGRAAPARVRQELSPGHASLQPQEQAAKKLRASKDAVATATTKLATDGNANEGVIVEEVRKREVTIRPLGAP